MSAGLFPRPEHTICKPAWRLAGLASSPAGLFCRKQGSGAAHSFYSWSSGKFKSKWGEITCQGCTSSAWGSLRDCKYNQAKKKFPWEIFSLFMLLHSKFSPLFSSPCFLLGERHDLPSAGTAVSVPTGSERLQICSSSPHPDGVKRSPYCMGRDLKHRVTLQLPQGHTCSLGHP